LVVTSGYYGCADYPKRRAPKAVRPDRSVDSAFRPGLAHRTRRIV